MLSPLAVSSPKTKILNGSYRSLPDFALISELDNLEKKYQDTLKKELEYKKWRENQARIEEEKLQARKIAYKFNAEYLKIQRQQADLKKQLDKDELMKPGIEPKMHGYPDIPETPKDIRRKRDLETMKSLNSSLTNQLKEKQKLNEEITQKLKKDEWIRNQNAKTSLQEEIDSKIDKKLREKELLRSYWDLDMKAKRIQKDINSVSYKGFIPSLSANSSMINLEEINSKSEEKNTEVLAQKLVNQISMPDLHETSRSAHKTPINSKLKAAEIQKKLNEKIQTSFQHKIKQSVQEAKLKRRNLHQSQTPKTPANLYSQRIVLKKLK